MRAADAGGFAGREAATPGGQGAAAELAGDGRGQHQPAQEPEFQGAQAADVGAGPCR